MLFEISNRFHFCIIWNTSFWYQSDWYGKRVEKKVKQHLQNIVKQTFNNHLKIKTKKEENEIPTLEVNENQFLSHGNNFQSQRISRKLLVDIDESIENRWWLKPQQCKYRKSTTSSCAIFMFFPLVNNFSYTRIKCYYNIVKYRILMWRQPIAFLFCVCTFDI